MVFVWLALYFPSRDFPQQIADLEAPLEKPREQLKSLKAELNALEGRAAPDDVAIQAKKNEIVAVKKQMAPDEDKVNEKLSEWKGQSWLGQAGKLIEPAVEPLGWDWRIGMAAIASFPAREVMVGTLGIIFGQGEGDAEDDEFRDALRDGLTKAERDGKPVFTVPVALSVMVFFALCCQCVSTLVVIKRETE